VISPACCGAWKRCVEILSGFGFLFVSVIVVRLEILLWTPEGMALKQALVWMLSAFGCFSCWFQLVGDALGIAGFRWLPRLVQCPGVERSSLFQWTSCGCSVLLASLFLTHPAGTGMLQVNDSSFLPQSLFAKFWNFVLHLSMSLWESLLFDL